MLSVYLKSYLLSRSLTILDFDVARTRCNDLGSLEDSKCQLIQTFQRAVPIGLKAEALRCYLESQQLAVLNSLKTLINAGELEQACKILTYPPRESKKKRSRSTGPKREKIDCAAREPFMADNDSDIHVTGQPVSMRSAMTLETDDTNNSWNDTLPELDLNVPWMAGDLPTIYTTLQDSHESPLFHSSIPSYTPSAATYPMMHECIFLTGPNGPSSPNTLSAVRPALIPPRSRRSIPTEEISDLATILKPAWEPGQMPIQQPFNVHGTFENDVLDPHITPTYTSDPRPPLSAEFEFNEDLFGFND